MEKKNRNLQSEVEILGDLLSKKLADDKEISALIQQIRDKGMMLTVVIEANPDIDEAELKFNQFDHNFLKKLKIRPNEDID
ncbi:MAG: hypothetical protein DRJ08_03560 [Acidobacteria bacterium]|nr:MAG: hypothetical protein DRJ14_04315 [Acidobacteriota bacterium]RLE22801.1 MAG: hypothetical protein DRJ08_03560 [Acidobacteriota bacterium]